MLPKINNQMQIILTMVGKTEQGYLPEAIEHYIKKLIHYTNFKIQVLPDVKNAKNISTGQLKEKEAELILNIITESDYVILLDENGKEYTSRGFADYLQKKMNSGFKNIHFVIGGAFGFHETVYKRANDKIALSKMTFSHQMVRLFFAEQLYRAMSILKNEKYHHD